LEGGPALAKGVILSFLRLVEAKSCVAIQKKALSIYLVASNS